MKILWLDTAVKDVSDIRDYIGRDNQQAALEVARCLRDRINNLSSHPEIGHPGRVCGTRELIIPNLPYVIPYRVRNNTIEILRVFHTARQWPLADSH